VDDAFADISKGRKMHDGTRLIGRENLVEPGPVQNIPFFERAPFHSPFVTIDQIVIRDGEITGPCKGFAGMRANIASPARHQYRLCRRLSHARPASGFSAKSSLK